MRPEDAPRFPPRRVTLKGDIPVSIRLLTREDASALGEFYAAIPAEDEFFYRPYPLTREQAAKVAAWSSSPFHVCVVAEMGAAEIAGYAWYRWQDEESVQSGFGICVARSVHRKGLGTALMQRVLEIGEQIGPPVMTLTVQKANPRAVKLYERVGFCIVREQERGTDSEPEYYMERPMRAAGSGKSPVNTAAQPGR